jgi:hypothetical protein
VNPALAPKIRAPPRVALTDFQLFNRHVLPRSRDAASPLPSAIRFVDQMDLNYQQNSLSLSFAAPEISLSPKLIYEYRVDGLDDEW